MAEFGQAETSKTKTLKEPRFKGSFLKSAIGLFIIIILGLFANYLWQDRFSPEARESRKQQEQYKKYFEFEEKYKKAMREDTYGGKTPEETLRLFIEALKKEDIELASKYFMLNSAGERDEKWLEGLRKTKEQNQISNTIHLLSMAVPDYEARLGEGDFKFKIYQGSRLVGYINLEYNPYSQVWKIESL